MYNSYFHKSVHFNLLQKGVSGSIIVRSLDRVVLTLLCIVYIIQVDLKDDYLVQIDILLTFPCKNLY